MNHREDGSPVNDEDTIMTIGPQEQDWPAIEDAPELASFTMSEADRDMAEGVARCADRMRRLTDRGL